MILVFWIGWHGWDGWMASPTRWTWVWVDFGSWWWTERPGVLRFTESQRVRHDWTTELNWTEHPVISTCVYYTIRKYTMIRCGMEYSVMCFIVIVFSLYVYFHEWGSNRFQLCECPSRGLDDAKLESRI